MEIIPVPFSSDNYAYLIRGRGQQAIAIDPGQGLPLITSVKKHSLELTAVLLTHHHGDHSGGVSALLAEWPQLTVYLHPLDRKRLPRLPCNDDQHDRLELAGLTIQVLHTPGHTQGSACFLIGEDLFCGDTLFGAGCGRLFEGTPARMYHSLNHTIGTLPATTRLWFGHEYCLDNLQFAATVEPENEAIRRRQLESEQVLKQGNQALPGTLEQEWATNPFLRCHESAVVAAARHHTPGTPGDEAAVFAVLRNWKNVFW